MSIKPNQSLAGGVFALFLSLSCCWMPFLIAIGLGSVSSVAAFSTSLEQFSGLFMTISASFLGYAGYTFYQKKKTNKTMSTIILQSIIICPNCQTSKEETMPTDACQFFYECTTCKTLLKPKAGDCCVYCSYATVPCPPIQENPKACCG